MDGLIITLKFYNSSVNFDFSIKKHDINNQKVFLFSLSMDLGSISKFSRFDPPHGQDFELVVFSAWLEPT